MFQPMQSNYILLSSLKSPTNIYTISGDMVSAYLNMRVSFLHTHKK